MFVGSRAVLNLMVLAMAMTLFVAACAGEPEEQTAEEPTGEEPTGEATDGEAADEEATEEEATEGEEEDVESDDEVDGGEPFPTDSIEYVIPFDAGGESDITARMQQGPLEEALGTDVVVTYQPGAGGALAWSQVSEGNPDGHTIYGYNMPHIVLQPLVQDDAAYETEDLQQVYMFQLTPYIIAVKADSPYQTFEDLMNAAEENPGAITLGGVGEFTGPHLVHLQLQDATDAEFTYVPFSGTGSLVPALLGGHVTAIITNTPAVVGNPEQLRGLAVAAEEEFTLLPDVPLLRDLDLDIVEGAYRGVAVPPDTPSERVQILADAIASVNEDEAMRTEMEEMGFLLVDFGPEEADEFIAERRETYIPLLQDLGVID